MQPTTSAAYLKFGAAAAIVATVAAGAISFTLPRSYVSTAVMRFTPGTVAGKPSWQIEIEAAHRLQEMQQGILGSSSLTEFIRRPDMDLYRKERATYPLEDVIQQMRNRDLRFERLPHRDFRVSFEYPDPVKAQAVVRELSTRLSGPSAVVTPASLPEKPSQPNRLAIMGIGTGAGLALGLGFVFLRRRGLKWTLRIAGCTVAGCALAVAIWLLMPDKFADDQKRYQFLALGTFTGLVVGAYLLRNRTTGGNRYARLIAFTAACGAIAGGLASFAIPERYVSTATLRAVPFSVAGAGAAQLQIEPAERLRELTDEIMSRGSMAELIQRPSLDLYREERQRRPLEDIIESMRRRDIRIAPTPPADLADFGDLGPGTKFQISFEYPDRDKAQVVVRELVTKFTEGNVLANRYLAGVRPGSDLPPDQTAGSLPYGIETGAGPNRIANVVLEVLDAASLPASSIFPNRPAVTAIGLLAGLLVGSFLAFRRWPAARRAATSGLHPPYWKYTFAAAAIGALAFGLWSFVTPNFYVSTAVLRVAPFPAGGAWTAQREIEYTARLRHLTQDILSRESLAELIQRPSLDLYREDRPRYPLEDIIYGMRSQAIRIAPTPFVLAGPGHLTSFEISFVYSDRDKAQAVVRELVTKFTEGNAEAERALHRDRTPGSLALEVLDPASLPGTPVSPNRPATAAVGLLAGVLGPLLAWRRQQRANRRAAGLRPLPSYWKYALPATILGAFLVSMAYTYFSLFISPRYVSTAVLRLVSADPRSSDSVQAAAEHMPEMFRKVLSSNNLATIIQQHNLQLYPQDRARRSLDEVVKQMHDRDLRVEPLRASPFGGHPTAFRISFEYSDLAKAQSCVHAVVGKFVEALPPPQQLYALPSHALPWPSAGPGRLLAVDSSVNPGFPQRDAADRLYNKLVEGGGDTQEKPYAAYLEVLDPADVHSLALPTGSARRSLALGGLAGLLLGIAIAHYRRYAQLAKEPAPTSR